MATALRVFHRYALVGEGWSAEGGASLRTFFVGACLRAFPTVYRRWCAEQDKEEPYGLDEADAPPAASSLRKCPNLAEQIVAEHATRNKLRSISKKSTREAAAQPYGFVCHSSLPAEFD